METGDYFVKGRSEAETTDQEHASIRDLLCLESVCSLCRHYSLASIQAYGNWGLSVVALVDLSS